MTGTKLTKQAKDVEYLKYVNTDEGRFSTLSDP